MAAAQSTAGRRLVFLMRASAASAKVAYITHCQSHADGADGRHHEGVCTAIAGRGEEITSQS